MLVVDDCPEIESIVVTHDPNGSEPMLWTVEKVFIPKIEEDITSLHV